MAFIVFEGLDGAGKSSLMRALTQRLDESHISYVQTREPGGTPLAEKIRQLILVGEHVPVPKAELLLYQAGRAQHVEQLIAPSLNQGKWVLSDRFTASTYAFQQGGRGIEKKDIDWLNKYACGDIKVDLFVLLDLPVTESLRRIEKRVDETGVKKDRFEKEQQDFHERVRNTYLDLAKNNTDSWLVLDACQAPDILIEQFLSFLETRGLLV